MALSGDMIVFSEERVKDATPVVSVSSEETLSSPADETPLASVCDMEYEVLQAPINSTVAARSVVSGEKIRTLLAPIGSVEATQFFGREEKAGTSEQALSLSEVVEGLGSICSMGFKASPGLIGTVSPAQLIGRAERTGPEEQLVILSGVMGEVIEGLENIGLSTGRPNTHTRRSPLPLWYPRRPLQDITAVLNNVPAPPQETSNFKKWSKKAQPVQLHAHLHENRGAFVQQRAARVPFKPTASVPATFKRSSLLRKGFR